MNLTPREREKLMIAERERMFFSGVCQDPRRTGRQPGLSRPDVGVDDA